MSDLLDHNPTTLRSGRSGGGLARFSSGVLSLVACALLSACTSTYYVRAADLSRARYQSDVVPAIDSTGKRTTIETRRIQQIRRWTPTGLLEVVVEESSGGEFLAAGLLAPGVFSIAASSSFPTSGHVALNRPILAAGAGQVAMGLVVLAASLSGPGDP